MDAAGEEASRSDTIRSPRSAGPSSSRRRRAASGGGAARCGGRRSAAGTGRPAARPARDTDSARTAPPPAPRPAAARPGAAPPDAAQRRRHVEPGATAAARSVNRRTPAPDLACVEPDGPVGARAAAGRTAPRRRPRAVRGWWPVPAARGSPPAAPGPAAPRRRPDARSCRPATGSPCRRSRSKKASIRLSLALLDPCVLASMTIAPPRSPIPASTAAPSTLALVADRGEVDQPGAVTVLVGGLMRAGGLDGEARLAGATGAEHGDQAPGGEQRVDPGEVVVAPDEAGQPGAGRLLGLVCDAGRSLGLVCGVGQVARLGRRGVGGRGGPLGAQQAQGGVRAGRCPGRCRGRRPGLRGPARTGPERRPGDLGRRARP